MSPNEAFVLRTVGQKYLRFYAETMVARSQGEVFADRHQATDWEDLSLEELARLLPGAEKRGLSREEMIDLLRYSPSPGGRSEDKKREDMVLVGQALNQWVARIGERSQGALGEAVIKEFWQGLVVRAYTSPQIPRPKGLAMAVGMLGLGQQEAEDLVKEGLFRLELMVGMEVMEGKKKESLENSRNSGTLSGFSALDSLAGGQCVRRD